MKRSSMPTCAVVLTGVSLLAALAGCATVDEKIGLNYARQHHSLDRHSGEIFVSRVESKPYTQNGYGEWIIGSINNVHGVHQADLLSDRSLGEWITGAVLQELRQAGYTATATPTLPSTAARGIVVSDIDVVMNVNRGVASADMKHELKFNVSVFLNGIKAKTFSVASRDDRTVPFFASKEDKEKIMLQSLQDAMKQVIPDIIALIDKK